VLDLFGIDEVRLDLALVGDAAVRQRFVEALVGIGEVDVLADDRDVDRLFRIAHDTHRVLPLLEVGRRRPHVELVDQALVEAFLVKGERHFVDAARRRAP
jgi:hypothetical protein